MKRTYQPNEICSMQVFQERIAQQVIVIGLPNDRGNRGHAGLLDRPQSPLSSDQLVSVCRGADNDRLQQADGTDGVDEFGVCVRVKFCSWLLGIGSDHADWEFGVPNWRAWRRLPCCGGDKGAQAFAESTWWCHPQSPVRLSDTFTVSRASSCSAAARYVRAPGDDGS
jgi:hypothetical protein